MKSLKNRVIKMEKWINAARDGESLESQIAALYAGEYGYTGGMALIVACKADGLEKAMERLPEKLRNYIRTTFAE